MNLKLQIQNDLSCYAIMYFFIIIVCRLTTTTATYGGQKTRLGSFSPAPFTWLLQFQSGFGACMAMALLTKPYLKPLLVSFKTPMIVLNMKFHSLG